MGFITFQYLELPCTLVNFPLCLFDGQAVDIITRTTQRSKAYPQCSSSSKMEYGNLGPIFLIEKSSHAFLALFLSMIQEESGMDSNLQ
jgi:hypothetical protein